jgi:DNA-binding MarR family transcriptional regulator
VTQSLETEARSRHLPSEAQDVLDLRLAIRRFDGATARACRRAGLTPQVYQLLLIVAARAPDALGVGVGEVAALLELGQPATSELVRRALAARLVERRPLEHDRRRAFLTLTGHGEETLGEVLAALRTERTELREWITRRNAVSPAREWR